MLFRSLGNEGNGFSQKKLCDFIEDWANNIVAWKVDGDTEEPIRLSTAITAIRKITIDEARKTETQQSNFRHALDTVEASSTEGLPDVLTFRTEPYKGLASRSFRLSLSIRTGGREPELVYRIVAREQHEEEIVEEFKALLVRELSETATVTIGTFTP